ncbi:Hypp5521 [Branchiostoma lanceolatum]|uniref:Hypp5521 protein n=1 Tax=Branchiostoma lanceolatum TaxID=7740 RepID=A0A8J9YL77_BRALA|nr:Hypp5521 [Branchiostoma lanceolatum]
MGCKGSDVSPGARLTHGWQRRLAESMSGVDFLRQGVTTVQSLGVREAGPGYVLSLADTPGVSSHLNVPTDATRHTGSLSRCPLRIEVSQAP